MQINPLIVELWLWMHRWTYNDPLRAKYNNKMAGMNRPIAKPAGSKKLKDWENV
jgi:microfibrillar-associated protein 1